MTFKQLCRQVVVLGTLLIWLIKFLIRPLHLLPHGADFMLGVAPNLLGSFLIPFGAYWFFHGRDHLMARLLRLQNAVELRQVCLIGFGLLVLNEYLQMIPVFGRTFDVYDILMSVPGLGLSYFSFTWLQQRYAASTG